jgi:hypothetical protein
MHTTSPPNPLTAGTTSVFRSPSEEYLASDGWTRALYLRGKSALDVTASSDADGFFYTLTAAATANLLPGDYRWAELALRGTAPVPPAPDLREAYPIGSGNLTVARNLVTAVAGDAQSTDEKELAAIDAEILRRATGGMLAAYQQDQFGVTLSADDVLYKRQRALRRRLYRKRHPGMFAGKALMGVGRS